MTTSDSDSADSSSDRSITGSISNFSSNFSSSSGALRPKAKPFPLVRFASRRFGAALVDASLVGFFSAVLVSIQLAVVSKGMGHVDPFSLAGCVIFASLLAFLHQLTYAGPLIYCGAAFWITQNIDEPYRGYFLIALAVVVPFCLLYQVVYECSYYRATPGKQLFGLQVVSASGAVSASAASGAKPLTFISILQRCLYKFCSSFALILPAIYLILCNRHQLLHDRLALANNQ